MKIVPPSHRILALPDKAAVLKMIERIGRTCYKSEDKMTLDSARDFVKSLIRSGHHSVIEHLGITVHFICDRGITHELVRHRLASFSQESTRYANYAKDKFGKEITVIRPFFWNRSSDLYSAWQQAMEQAREGLFAAHRPGSPPRGGSDRPPQQLEDRTHHDLQLSGVEAHFRPALLPGRPPADEGASISCFSMNFAKEFPVVFDDLADKYAADLRGWPRRGQVRTKARTRGSDRKGGTGI